VDGKLVHDMKIEKTNLRGPRVDEARMKPTTTFAKSFN
jgi:hypothetical protein